MSKRLIQHAETIETFDVSCALPTVSRRRFLQSGAVLIEAGLSARPRC